MSTLPQNDQMDYFHPLKSKRAYNTLSILRKYYYKNGHKCLLSITYYLLSFQNTNHFNISSYHVCCLTNYKAKASICGLPIREQDRKYFEFSFDHTYYIFNSLCFGYSPAPDFFQYFSQEIVRILREQNVGCEVELDDFLIHANSYKKCKKDVELVIYLLSYFGFKINFSKSCLIPSQKMDF